MGVLTRWTGQGFIYGLFFTFSTLLWLSVGRRTTTGQLGGPFTKLSVGELLLSLTFIGEGAASFFRRGAFVAHYLAGSCFSSCSASSIRRAALVSKETSSVST